jgi:hypothetical protein
MAERVERHNQDFSLSYHSWFESVFKDKCWRSWRQPPKEKTPIGVAANTPA